MYAAAMNGGSRENMCMYVRPSSFSGLAAYEKPDRIIRHWFFFSQNAIWCSSAHIQYMMSFVFASVILDTGSIVPDSYSVAVAMEIVTT
jgi:hypothetical protein